MDEWTSNKLIYEQFKDLIEEEKVRQPAKRDRVLSLMNKPKSMKSFGLPLDPEFVFDAAGTLGYTHHGADPYYAEWFPFKEYLATGRIALDDARHLIH